jgi:hypothetical protein
MTVIYLEVLVIYLLVIYLDASLVDEVVASFHGLQASSVPFRPSGFV